MQTFKAVHAPLCLNKQLIGYLPGNEHVHEKGNQIAQLVNTSNCSSWTQDHVHSMHFWCVFMSKMYLNENRVNKDGHTGTDIKASKMI